MKYKLINQITKTEYLCDKVTIDEFDYYVDYSQPIKVGKWYISNQAPRLCVKVKEGSYPYIHLNNKGEEIADFHTWRGVIICCNNPNIDVPKVVDKAELLAKNIYRDNPTDRKDAIYRYNTDINAPRKRKAFVKGYRKSEETHPFSEEDIIEFAEWLLYSPEASFSTPTKQLIQLWKEQKPKIVYYE